MSDLVLDASVALGWLIDNPASKYARRVQTLMIGGSRAIVPVHWHLEITNAILTSARRMYLSRSITEVLAEISALLPFIETDLRLEEIGALIKVGQLYQLTAYDSAYINLAFRRNLPIATQDKAMAAAARNLKIPLIA